MASDGFRFAWVAGAAHEIFKDEREHRNSLVIAGLCKRIRVLFFQWFLVAVSGY
jgi:hypothetical protein